MFEPMLLMELSNRFNLPYPAQYHKLWKKQSLQIIVNPILMSHTLLYLMSQGLLSVMNHTQMNYKPPHVHPRNSLWNKIMAMRLLFLITQAIPTCQKIQPPLQMTKLALHILQHSRAIKQSYLQIFYQMIHNLRCLTGSEHK